MAIQAAGVIFLYQEIPMLLPGEQGQLFWMVHLIAHKIRKGCNLGRRGGGKGNGAVGPKAPKQLEGLLQNREKPLAYPAGENSVGGVLDIRLV